MQTIDQVITSIARTCAALGVVDKQLIVESLNQAQDIVKEKYNWPFFQKSADITLVDGTNTYDLPSDFDSIARVYYIDTDGTYVSLDPASDPSFFDGHDTDTTDSPEYYRLAGMDATNHRVKIELTPVPSGDHIATYGSALKLAYYRVPAAIAAGSSNMDWPQEFHAVIQWGAVVLYATGQGDTGLLQSAAAIYGQTLRAQEKKYRLRYRAPFLVNMRSEDGPNPGPRGESGEDYGRKGY